MLYRKEERGRNRFSADGNGIHCHKIVMWIRPTTRLHYDKAHHSGQLKIVSKSSYRTVLVYFNINNSTKSYYSYFQLQNNLHVI